LSKGPFQVFSDLANQPLGVLEKIGAFGASQVGKLSDPGQAVTPANIEALTGTPMQVAGSSSDDTTTGSDAREAFDAGLGDDTTAPGGGFEASNLARAGMWCAPRQRIWTVIGLSRSTCCWN